LQSHEIACRAGDAVSVATGIPVDIHNPALRVGIEISPQATSVFAERRPAPGGLPAGVSGRAILLLSGGIDSPVAGWLAAKRGLAQEALTFHSPPFTGEKAKDKVIALARQLSRWQAVSTLWIAGFTETQKRLRAAGRPELAVVLYRRMMVRVADLLCDRAHCGAIVTGENLGQVASQTLTNMRNIEVAGRHLILRPLLTYDKVETTALARRIGTYDISALPFEDCCSLFVPAQPGHRSQAFRRRTRRGDAGCGQGSRRHRGTGRADRVVSASDCYWQTMVRGRNGTCPRAQERAEALRPVGVVARFTRPRFGHAMAGRIAVGVADTTSAATAITPDRDLGHTFQSRAVAIVQHRITSIANSRRIAGLSVGGKLAANPGVWAICHTVRPVRAGTAGG